MKRVLIVDDKEENLYYLQALLSAHGYEVEAANHGAAALVAARQHPPDLVVSDLLMPVMDGYTLLRHWKADARLKQIPFVVYTATYTEPEDERLAIGLGADAFILKPAEPDEFLARIRQVEAIAAEAVRPAPRTRSGDEIVLLKSYSETLIRKLEEKSLQLEESNRALQQDIAERKRAEARLLESEETQRCLAQSQMAILNALPAHIALIDSEGWIVSVNEAWRRFAAENVLGSANFGVRENYLEICDRACGNGAAEAADTAAAIRRVLDGEADEFVLVYPCHSPSIERWFRLMVTPLPGGPRMGAVVMHIDVTERELMDRQLRKLNRTYAVLSDLNKLIVREREPQSILEGACRIAVEKGGFRMAWIGMVHPETRELQAIASSCAEEDSGSSPGVKVDDETRSGGPAARCLAGGEHVICSDIENDPEFSVWLGEALRRGYRSTASFPIHVEGQVVGVLGLYAGESEFFDTEEMNLLDELATDIGFALEVSRRGAERRHAIEQLRESEERFRELAETIQEVFWVTDPEKYQMLYISPAYEKIWGRTCASLYESPGNWTEAIHPDDRARVVDAARARQMSGEYDETYRIVRPDGSVRWVRDRAFPVFGEDGKVQRIVGTAEDITNRRLLEEQFRQAQKMEAIGQLAGGVAHDFNNILAAILGNTQMGLAETTDGHPVRQSLEEIHKAGLRATSLVQQILAFSSQRPQERRVIELGPTIEEAVGFLRATIPSVVEFVVSIDPDLPAVLADPTQVHQVLTNLCTNAWHALADQPGRIEVAVRATDPDSDAAGRPVGLRPGPAVCLSVTDTGEGMDAATLERVFDPFFTTKGPGKGTGLGLSVVHGIVQGHDGAIRVTSHPGRGTTFAVYFPAAARPVSEQAAAVRVSRTAKGQHILYLDDEEPLVYLATRMLERLGYRVSGFTSAAEAMKAFRENPDQYDLVIADLNMPGASGLQVAAELLKLRPDLPVALCSGHVTEEQRDRARKLGIREVLYKPNTMAELSETIDRLAAETRRA